MHRQPAVPGLPDLDRRVQHLSALAYSDNTKKGMQTAERNFLRFCALFDIHIDSNGITDADLARYVAWLEAQPSITSAATISTYLSAGVRHYHQRRGLPWPQLKSRPPVALVMRGARRSLKAGTGTRQKLPITVPMLRAFRSHLFLGDPEHLCIWTAILCAFYALLRKANVAAPSRGAPKPPELSPTAVAGVLCRSDVEVVSRDHGNRTDTWLVLRDTKTIQFGERVLRLPLPTIPGDPLCPTAALHLYMEVTADRPRDTQLFGYVDRRTGQWIPLTHSVFVARIKDLVRLAGWDPAAYAGHSLRRGGATFAFSEAHLHPLLIKALGDWLSNAFMRYCEAQTGMRLAGAQALASATLADARSAA